MKDNQLDLAELNKKLDEAFQSEEGLNDEKHEEAKRKFNEHWKEIIRKRDEEIDADVAEAKKKHDVWWNEIVQRDNEETEKRGGYMVIKEFKALK